eukprot:TRINITY_DN16362_c0_g1_i1.p1 TRINITY_DN16362_c0_g1~~TRINITY_DN16362_c0_g1_i1.p1  ORF type:complete len:1658 (-),score=351.35 TRINITY_DN16362_c0_g1_i1:129-5102(-)
MSGPQVDGSGLFRRGKTIEQIYQKKTQLEHILLRPDSYVGSTELQQYELWVCDAAATKLVHRQVQFVPALYKIFDEILVNAADNFMRDSKGMDLIDVTINSQNGFISVLNNGKGIPVHMHKEHRCYVPELIFGHLLTSDNYDDNERKVTGGRNGFGAKLANVFSTKFIVETADRKSKKRFRQVFEKNMTQKHEPFIEDYAGNDFTKVTFYPDLRRFGMQELDADITSLMMKRVFDLAGSTNKRCRVILNGKQLPITCFQDYVQLYLGNEESQPCISERVNDRWEVAFSVSEGAFQQVSFVNSINTTKGGTHVAHVAEQVVDAILKAVRAKNRGGMEIKAAMVRNHLWVFVNCLIENPAFDSQTKETLTTKQSKFGSSCDLSERTVKQVLKSGVVELILDWVKAKEKVDLGKHLKAGSKNSTRVLGMPKLEDANLAGTRHSEECTLILTEGDSAKALAVAGLSVIGRDRYGVFPLKGKVLNVRDANFKQVTGNTEIQNLLKILGIEVSKRYSSARDLRYGSLMLMTDQDPDGSHIKGLLINMVHHWWPGLLPAGFLKEFVTPIVKVWKDGSRDGERHSEQSFFTVKEYELWKESAAGQKSWKSKYYKGLGTSTAKEAKEYFAHLATHEIKFRWTGDHDGEAIDLAFNKKRADDRKEWINKYQDGDFVDHSCRQLKYTDFINKELVQFAKYDVMRSIPSFVDGFKPSQRKVLYGAFKKKLKADIKVAQFVGYVSEQSAYHHGEVSLENTIVNLAQNFVGSNNINLLIPSGQFGTRLQGGKDHAAARYIFTRLNVVTRLLFHPDDDHVLEYLEDEGQRIEPRWYCPVIPTVLVNGADGIGVGWSTSIPNYSPREIITNIRRMLRGQPMREMMPWYRGFKGNVSPSEGEEGKFDVVGVIERKSDTSLEITELPIKVWTQSYKEFLEGLVPQEKKRGEESDHTLEDFREHHTENSVHFILKVARDKMQKVERQGLEKAFKLKSSIAVTNMMLFDKDGKMTKFSTPMEILVNFCALRLDVYRKRKAYLVGKLRREKETLSNKARFILMVVRGELELRKRKKVELLQELKMLGFKRQSELDGLMTSTLTASGEADDGNTPIAEGAGSAVAGAAGGDAKSDFDYLLGMPMWNLTHEKVEEILKLRDAKAAELDTLQATTLEQLWDRDLEALTVGLNEFETRLAEEESAGGGAGRRGGKRQRTLSTAPTAQAAGATVTKPIVEDPTLKLPLRPCGELLGRRISELRASRESATATKQNGASVAVVEPLVAMPSGQAHSVHDQPAAVLDLLDSQNDPLDEMVSVPTAVRRLRDEASRTAYSTESLTINDDGDGDAVEAVPPSVLRHATPSSEFGVFPPPLAGNTSLRDLATSDSGGNREGDVLAQLRQRMRTRKRVLANDVDMEDEPAAASSTSSTVPLVPNGTTSSGAMSSAKIDEIDLFFTDDAPSAPTSVPRMLGGASDGTARASAPFGRRQAQIVKQTSARGQITSGTSSERFAEDLTVEVVDVVDEGALGNNGRGGAETCSSIHGSFAGHSSGDASYCGLGVSGSRVESTVVGASSATSPAQDSLPFRAQPGGGIGFGEGFTSSSHPSFSGSSFGGCDTTATIVTPARAAELMRNDSLGSSATEVDTDVSNKTSPQQRRKRLRVFMAADDDDDDDPVEVCSV